MLHVDKVRSSLTFKFPFAVRWYVEAISSAWFFFGEPNICPRNPSWHFLMVDKRLGVGHGMYDGVGDTFFPLDILHDLIVRGCKGIDFALHIL